MKQTNEMFLTNTNRNNFIDILKFVAIVFVIIHHIVVSLCGENVAIRAGLPFYAYQGVPIFLLVSGYVWSKSYDKHKVNDVASAYRTSFIVKKMIRFYVPFIAMYLIQLIIAFSTGVNRDQNWVKLFFMGGISGKGDYYFALLFQMIFIIPLLYFIIKKYKLSGVFGIFIFNIIFEVVRWAIDMPIDIYKFLIFRFLIVIAYGIYLSFNDKSKQNLVLSLLCLFVGLGCLIWFYYTPYKCVFFYEQNWKHTNFLTLLYIIPICGFLIRKISFKNKIIAFPGKMSYSGFISQNIVLVFISVFPSNQNLWLHSLILLGFIVLFTITFYVLLEWLACKGLTNVVDKISKWYKVKNQQKQSNKYN